MMHIRAHNLANHDLFCDVVLTDTDLRLINECVRLIEQPDEKISLTLFGNRPATLSLMPDTAIPIVKSV